MSALALSREQSAVRRVWGCWDVSCWQTLRVNTVLSSATIPSPVRMGSGWAGSQIGLGVQGTCSKVCSEIKKKVLPGNECQRAAVPSPLLRSPSPPHLCLWWHSLGWQGYTHLRGQPCSPSAAHKLKVQSSIKCLKKPPVLNSIVSNVCPRRISAQFMLLINRDEHL